jgi:tRNA G18 (ribose-2'-O)-methylase SpoU
MTGEPARDPSATTSIILACHTIKDPRDLAEVIHLAAGFDAAVHLLGNSLRPDHPKVLRKLKSWRPALAEHPEKIEAKLFAHFGDWLSEIRGGGFSMVAAVVEGGVRPWSWPSRGKLAVLLGEETHGLPPEILAECQHRWTIPLGPGGRFYTVGQAAAIILGGTSHG